MNTWEEVEQQPEYGVLTPEDKAAVHDEWHKSVLNTLADEDPEKVDAAGVNRFIATEKARSKTFTTGGSFDPATAQKEYDLEVRERAGAQKQTLVDYDALLDREYRLQDARSMPGVDEFGRTSPEWDASVQAASQEVEAARAKLAPEQLQQAREAREALKGERDTAVLGSDLYTNPALVLDKDKYRKAVAESGASPEAKALKLASFQNEKRRYLDEAINTLAKGDPLIPLAESFPKFLEAKGFNLLQEMEQQAEGKLDYSPIQKQRDLAQEYLTKMQDRGWFRKIGSTISTGVATGMLDIGTQAAGVAAMATGDEETSKVAAELSRAGGDIGAAQGLEGDMQATGGTFTGGVARLGTNMAPMLIPGGAVGGLARVAGAGAGAATAAAVGASALTAGAQTAGSQFGEVYDHLRLKGKTHEEAFGVSRNAAVLSGAVTTALTALGGATGVEALLRQGGKELVKSRLVAALRAVPGGAAAEIAEELPDEYVSQLVSAFAKDPNTSPSQVTDEFAANAPDLILQIAALGGVGSGVGRFKETTTDPAKAAQEQEFPAAGAPPDLSQQDRDNFAKGGVPIFDTEGNVTGYTAPRAAEATVSNEDIRKAAEEAIKQRGTPVEVDGQVIAHVLDPDLTPEQVADFAGEPDTLKALARAGKITLPEIVTPVEGVDPAITDGMNERVAASAALAPQTVEALKAAQTVDTGTDISEAQIPPTVGETAAPEVDISEESLQREWQKLEDRALAAIEFGATDRVPAIRDEQASISKRLLDARTKEVKPVETLGVTSPPAPTLDTPEGAARNADMLRQAAARAAGTEQGPRIGFINPSVKLDLTPEESIATDAGMKEENQQTPELPQNKSRQHRGETASWVIRNRKTGEVIKETFEPEEVRKLNTSKYEAVPIGDYLESLNAPPERPTPGMSRKDFNRGMAAKVKQAATEKGVLPNQVAEPAQVAGFSRTDIEVPEFESLSEYAKEGYMKGERVTSGVAAGFISTPDTYFVDPSQMPKGAVMDDDLQGYAYPRDDGKVGYTFMDLDGVARVGIPPDDLAAKVIKLEKTKRVSPVTTETEIPSNTANVAGGSQSVQTEPAEGSIPAVTEDIVSTSDIPSTAEVQPAATLEPGEEGANLQQSSEQSGLGAGAATTPAVEDWSPQINEPVSFTAPNGQKLVGTVQSIDNGKAVVRFPWNGKEITQVVPVGQLSRPVASLTQAPNYQYTQEQNTRKMGKHFPTTIGVHANHDFRKSFASMAKDKSLNPIYQQIARVLSKMSAFANVDLHVAADENQSYAGEYSFDKGKASIAVNLRQVGRGRVDALGTLLHEALHHATLAKVRDPQGAWENDVLGKLDIIREKVLEYAKSKGLDQKLEYELDTVEEFITAVFTRPDFQNFLASIPDSFSTGVGVGKFRSVLSEVFRLITEFLSGEPVARGSPMEQSMTTILALFETPFRTVETGKLQALNAAQSTPSVKSTTAKSYAGEKAEVPQFMRDSLETAKAMAAAGKTSEEIRAVTGWFPGKYDGKMRWEIPDEGAKLHKDWQSKDTVGEAIDHPDLFRAYPEARDIYLKELLHPGMEAASYQDGVIRFRKSANLSILLHEVQHWIQDQEGFAKGGDSRMAFADPRMGLGSREGIRGATRILKRILGDIRKPLSIEAFAKQAWQADVVTPDIEASYKDYLATKKKAATDYNLERLAQETAAKEWYRNLAGEIEARDVQARQHFTPEQRKAVAPYSSENIAKEDAIVMFGGSGAQESRGYRSPTSMLAKTAETMKGMDRPVAKPINLSAAYQKAATGKSSAWVPIKDVYAQAKEADPALTPEAFMARINEQNEAGGIMVSPVEKTETVEAAKPFVVGGAGVEMLVPGRTPKSLVTEEQDEEYLQAVESGNVAKQQAMVDAAAKAAMPDSVVHERMFSSKERRQDKPLLKVYHGTDQEFNTFESGRPTADDWGFLGTIETNRHGNFFAENKTFAETYAKARQGKRVITAFLNITNPFQFTDAQDILESRELGEEMTPDFHMARWLMSLKHQWEAFDGREGVDFTNWLREKGYDGAFIQEDGHGLVDAEEAQDVWVALDPNQIKSADPVTRDADGNVIPLNQRFNPESNSILYAAPINPSQSNEAPADNLGTGASDAQRGGDVPSAVRGAGTADTEAGGGTNPASVLAKLKAGREAAISSAVAESDWGNYTSQQKTEALNSFIRSTYGAASLHDWSRLRGVSGPVFIRGAKGFASVEGNVSANEGLRIALTYDHRNGFESGVNGNASARDMFTFAYDVAQEEIIHAADKIGAFQRWEAAGRPGTFGAFERGESLQVVYQLNKARAGLQQTDPVAAQKIKDAMLASWAVYHGTPMAGISGLVRHLESAKNASTYLYELRRQLTQLKRQDFTTETGWQKFRNMLKQWLTDAINALRGVQDIFRSGMAGGLIQRQLADLEAALEGEPLPPVSRGTAASLAEEPDQREADKVFGVMAEDDRFEEGVKQFDKAKRARLGAPPQASANTSTPPRFTSSAQFAAAFEAAFLRGDFDYFLEALKQADRHIYVPEMKRYMNASKLGDADAAARLDWFRSAIAGTVPATAKPQTKTAPPQPAAVGAPASPPPPTVTPPPKAGTSNRPMLTLSTPAMGLIAKMLGAGIRINKLLRRARGRIKLSMADGSEIELSEHLFKDPVQAAKTLAHEIGHLFDFLPASGFTKTLVHKLAPLGDFRQVFGNDLADWFMDGGKKIKISKINQLIKPELVALSKKWRGDFSPSDKYRASGKELYADFISAILNDPMWAAKNAPYATLGFLNALEQKPEVEQAYQLLVSLVQGGSLYKALAEADQTKSATALERLIAKSSALMRAKKTLNDAARGLYRSMFGKWLPTAIRDGGIWKSYWKRLKSVGTFKDYNWAQEEASQFAVREITRFDDALANAVGIPLKLAGIDPDYLQRLQTNNRIIHERRRVGALIEKDPVKARQLLKWMVEAGLLGKDVQAEVDATADDDLYALTAKVIYKLHASGEGFERALKAARRKNAPADAEKALYAFDVSGFMLNPKVHTMATAEADNADIKQTLGPDQFAELERINEGYHDLIKRTMVEANNLGLFRPSTWTDVIVPNFGVYVPFMPIKYFTGHVKGGIGPARVGTAHDLMAPHVVGTLKMHALIYRMQQQKQAHILLDFFNNNGFSKELEPVEDENFDKLKADELTKQSKHTISFVPYWDEGEYKWVKVNGTDAVPLMQNADPDDLAALYKVMRSNTQLWRLNFTIFSIAFNVTNALRNVASPAADIGPKAGYKAAKQLLSAFPHMAKWVWSKMRGKDPASLVAASIAVEHARHKPGMVASKELQEFYDRNILQPMPDVASLRMTEEELARSVLGAMSAPEFLLQGVHKPAKDANWYDNTLKQYVHAATDFLSFIGSVSEAAPKIAAYQALKEKKDSKGAAKFTDAEATYLATLEGIPRPSVAGAHNAALEMVLMFFRVAAQSWRKHIIMATQPKTRAGFLMRHMLFEGAKFGLQAMAANGAVDYLIALGAAAAAGDDEDPEKYKQVDWAEAMDRQSSYKLSHGGIGPLLCWVLPDGSIEPPWGHKTIPADWTPVMPRLPGTELSREADPLAYYATSKTLAPSIAPVNDDVFWNDFMRTIIPSLNPTFEVVSDAMSVLGPTPPRDSYRGREKVEQRIWDEGYVARMLGLGEHHLKSFGIGSNSYDTKLPGAWNVLKQPGFKSLVASDNMVGVRAEQKARHEEELTSSYAQNMVGEKFNAIKKTYNRLKSKETPKTPQEEATYRMLSPVMSHSFYGTEKRDGLYDDLQRYARMKAKGLRDTDGAKVLKEQADQSVKDLESLATELQKSMEYLRTHTLP